MEINIEKMVQNAAEKVMQDLRDNGVFIGSWIPVSEMLPEKEGWYLCTICKRGVKPKVIRLWCWHRHHAGDIWWESCDGWKDWKARGWKVNAWMPSPAPYDPQESENSANLCIRCTNERCVMQSGICRNNCDFFIPEESEDKT